MQTWFVSLLTFLAEACCSEGDGRHKPQFLCYFISELTTCHFLHVPLFTESKFLAPAHIQGSDRV